MIKLLLVLPLLLTASCHGCGTGAPGRDLAVPDLTQTADLAPAGPADMACVPQFKQCLSPAVCCAGLACVGGACAKVP